MQRRFYMNANNTPPQTSSDTMTGLGKLIFRVTTAGGAIPLEGAQVIVRQKGSEGNPDRGDALAVMTSDQNGKTPPLELPTPAKALSMAPRPDRTISPFACYDAEVTLSGYYTVNFVCIPIFDGVTSIQPVTLIPLPENGRVDGVTPDDTLIIEGENPNL